ncbi:Uncharacterized conserved protein YlxW, UPF0749 family [Pelagirhabdus alkalitolerans]|uniref:Uncharacterized conserved protein YlxW, UPF0749 family n=1 Tax=Pelagirhabdus alkalitolerans TaxID=1612202 RepID=A0A1G6H0D7_9BACI|nr:DUF881 domain-containing protein [Pelagirhabdus alkalitolerans]SDB87608.1 Uncharacterized conserved protein YlxW, UPF0749 family [Pelagirhabdus alkalitolerans]
MKMKSKRAILSLVLFTFGFLIAASFQNTKAFVFEQEDVDPDWERTFYYTQQLIDFEKQNQDLQQEINEVRADILQFENELVSSEEEIKDTVQEKIDLQALNGELPIEGPGIFITLKDQEYVPSEESIDDYIVHDRHVQLVINELYSAGAEAIAINGQRIYHDSHIVCTGPVISVDNQQYPAPFEIEAIGNPNTLRESMELDRGVIDQLVNEQIEVEVGAREQINMNSKLR